MVCFVVIFFKRGNREGEEVREVKEKIWRLI